MNNKEKYIKYVNDNFNNRPKEILLNQIDLFYSNNGNIEKNKYKKGDLVKLKKGTFMHGIFGNIDNFDYTINNGFISTNFTGEIRANKIKNSVGMWNIQEDILLRDYIINYSGFTITYEIGRGPESKKVSKLIPYHRFDEITEKINNDDSIWSYSGSRTKEISFMPSLVSNKRQLAFILNMESEYANKMKENDVWNTYLDKEILYPFLDERYYEKFLIERFEKDASTTDRESAIMFGLPISLVEGILVGRQIEQDESKLNYIKSKLKDCYICNLDGVVIVSNDM